MRSEEWEIVTIERLSAALLTFLWNESILVRYWVVSTSYDPRVLVHFFNYGQDDQSWSLERDKLVSIQKLTELNTNLLVEKCLA